MQLQEGAEAADKMAAQIASWPGAVPPSAAAVMVEPAVTPLTALLRAKTTAVAALVRQQEAAGKQSAAREVDGTPSSHRHLASTAGQQQSGAAPIRIKPLFQLSSSTPSAAAARIKNEIIPTAIAAITKFVRVKQGATGAPLAAQPFDGRQSCLAEISGQAPDPAKSEWGRVGMVPSTALRVQTWTISPTLH